MTLQLGRLDENKEVVCSGLTPRTAALIYNLQNEVKSMKTKVKELESQVEEQKEINRSVHNLQSQFNVLQLNGDRAEIDMLKATCRNLQSRISGSSREFERKLGELEKALIEAAAADSVESLNRQIAKLGAMVSQIGDSSSEQGRILKNLVQDKRHQQGQLDDLEDRVDIHDIQIADLGQRIKDLEEVSSKFNAQLEIIETSHRVISERVIQLHHSLGSGFALAGTHSIKKELLEILEAEIRASLVSVEETLSELVQFAEVQGEQMKSLTRTIDVVESNHENSLVEIKSALEEKFTDMEGMNNTLNHLSNRVDEVEERLEQVDKRLAEVEERLDQVEKHLNEGAGAIRETLLDYLETTVATFEELFSLQRLKDIETQTSELAKGLEDLRRAISEKQGEDQVLVRELENVIKVITIHDEVLEHARKSVSSLADSSDDSGVALMSVLATMDQVTLRVKELEERLKDQDVATIQVSVEDIQDTYQQQLADAVKEAGPGQGKAWSTTHFTNVMKNLLNRIKTALSEDTRSVELHIDSNDDKAMNTLKELIDKGHSKPIAKANMKQRYITDEYVTEKSLDIDKSENKITFGPLELGILFIILAIHGRQDGMKLDYKLSLVINKLRECGCPLRLQTQLPLRRQEFKPVTAANMPTDPAGQVQLIVGRFKKSEKQEKQFKDCCTFIPESVVGEPHRSLLKEEFADLQFVEDIRESTSERLRRKMLLNRDAESTGEGNTSSSSESNQSNKLRSIAQTIKSLCPVRRVKKGLSE